jgi:hypothetical protein
MISRWFWISLIAAYSTPRAAKIAIAAPTPAEDGEEGRPGKGQTRPSLPEGADVRNPG